MSLPTNFQYSRLRDLLPVDQLPDNLGFLKDGIVALFDQLMGPEYGIYIVKLLKFLNYSSAK